MGWDAAPGARLKPGADVDVVDGCPNENLGADDVDGAGGIKVFEGEDDDVPENEKRGVVGFELSDVVVEVEMGGGTRASDLAAAGVEEKVTGEGEALEVAPKIGTWDLVVGGTTTAGDEAEEEVSGFAKENGAGLEALSVEGG